MNTLNQSQSILEGAPLPFINAVKERLGAYSEAYITLDTETGQYDFKCHIAISNNPNKSIKHLGTVYSHELLTEAERIVSYVKNFKDFPWRAGSEGAKEFTYKGEKDWKELYSDWKDVFMNNDGNLVFIK